MVAIDPWNTERSASVTNLLLLRIGHDGILIYQFRLSLQNGFNKQDHFSGPSNTQFLSSEALIHIDYLGVLLIDTSQLAFNLRQANNQCRLFVGISLRVNLVLISAFKRAFLEKIMTDFCPQASD